MYAVAADPLLWAVHPAQVRWQEAKFRAFFDDGLASGGALAIVDAATGAVIGSSRYDFGRGRGGGGRDWLDLAGLVALRRRDQWGGRAADVEPCAGVLRSGYLPDQEG